MSGLKGSLMLGLVGAILGGKVGGLQGAAIGGGIGLGAGLLNELIDWQKNLLEDFGTKRVNGKTVSNEEFKKVQNNTININTQVNTDGNIAPSILEKHQKKGVLDALQLNNSGF